MCPMFGELDRNGFSDTAGRTGYNGNLVVE
jgi:hypothetical protein